MHTSYFLSLYAYFSHFISLHTCYRLSEDLCWLVMWEVCFVDWNNHLVPVLFTPLPFLFISLKCFLLLVDTGLPCSRKDLALYVYIENKYSDKNDADGHSMWQIPVAGGATHSSELLWARYCGVHYILHVRTKLYLHTPIEMPIPYYGKTLVPLTTSVNCHWSVLGWGQRRMKWVKFKCVCITLQGCFITLLKMEK